MVGRCAYCGGAWETVSGDHACAVCKDPVLVCNHCAQALPSESGGGGGEVGPTATAAAAPFAASYHCASHAHLGHCYFADLSRWADPLDRANGAALKAQAAALDGFERLLSGDKAMKNRRRTLRRQRLRVEGLLATFPPE